MNFVKKFFSEWKWTILSGVVILLLALGLRLYNLTLLPVFADEAIYIRWAQVMGNEPTLRFLPLSDGKQPLFMWILMFYVRYLSDPLFAGRLLSVVSGLGTMTGIFAVSHLLFKSKKVSLIAVLIWAISPFSFFFDRMALVDSLLATFSVWTIFFGVLTAKYARFDFAMLAGFFLGGAFLTKSPALFVALLMPSTWIFASWEKSPRKNIVTVIKLGALLAATYVIAYGFYNILRLGPNFHLLTSRTADYVFPISHLWTDPKDPFIFHIKQIFTDWFIKMGPWPILGLGLIGLWVNWKKHWKEALFLLTWFFFPVLIQSEYAKVSTVRYILYTLPPAFILAAGALNGLKTKWLQITAYGFLILFVFTALRFNYLLLTDPEKANLPSSEKSGYLEEWTAGTGIWEVADFLKTEQIKNPDAKIVVGTEGYFGTLPDGLQMYLSDTPEITVIGVGLDFTDIPQSLKESFESGNKTYLVVNHSRINIKEKDYRKFGLKLISSYKKSDRREKESREYILKGPFETLYLFEIITSVDENN
ncbi:MAG: hypothetical protein UX13_C0002G0010 [Candidatus Woesebacteria bacterium GW2011_GWB1_45_5]|uniref:Glycosyltransferase RgtA/B/C/D-like domain-containing protein n=1 Tax=Candidatus Woesebacteria bacterium GW2011_GWB1_45_5 TaxID=1618581 RepID=A0A0G1QQD5_9BACT|nr:MAG: hypothetical protein UX13_C0002G0010 [Candidatus Woesebacteria bacterium GW2011_GWB1_45_5]